MKLIINSIHFLQTAHVWPTSDRGFQGHQQSPLCCKKCYSALLLRMTMVKTTKVIKGIKKGRCLPSVYHFTVSRDLTHSDSQPLSNPVRSLWSWLTASGLQKSTLGFSVVTSSRDTKQGNGWSRPEDVSNDEFRLGISKWGSPRPGKLCLDEWMDRFSSIATHTSFLEMFSRKWKKEKKIPFLVLSTYADSEGGAHTHPLWEVHRLDFNLASAGTTKDAYLMPGRQSFSRAVPVLLRPVGRQVPWQKEGRPLQLQEKETWGETSPHCSTQPEERATHLSNLPQVLIWLQVTSKPRVEAEEELVVLDRSGCFVAPSGWSINYCW